MSLGNKLCLHFQKNVIIHYFINNLHPNVKNFHFFCRSLNLQKNRLIGPSRISEHFLFDFVTAFLCCSVENKPRCSDCSTFVREAGLHHFVIYSTLTTNNVYVFAIDLDATASVTVICLFS